MRAPVRFRCATFRENFSELIQSTFHPSEKRSGPERAALAEVRGEPFACEKWKKRLTPPAHFRLFIALPVPEAVKDEFEEAQRQLRRGLPEGCVRWTSRPQFHLTLKFLGNVAAAQLDALRGSVQTAVQKFHPLALRAERIGFFPHARSPRVIWAQVRDREGQLPLLQQAVESAAREFTREPAEEKFTGHVTLGRAKRIHRREAESLFKLALGMTDRVFGEWTTERIEVLRSVLSPQGSTHSVLATIPLGGSAA